MSLPCSFANKEVNIGSVTSVLGPYYKQPSIYSRAMTDLDPHVRDYFKAGARFIPDAVN